MGSVVALYEPPTVFAIVIFATSVLGSAFLPAYFCAVWWRKANTAGALSSMVVGAGVAFGWEIAGMVASTQVAPMTAGVASSITTMIVVSLLTQKINPVPDAIVRAMDDAASIGAASDPLAEASDMALGPEATAIDTRLNGDDRDE